LLIKFSLNYDTNLVETIEMKNNRTKIYLII
jgi:hypothetical protein